MTVELAGAVVSAAIFVIAIGAAIRFVEWLAR